MFVILFIYEKIKVYRNTIDKKNSCNYHKCSLFLATFIFKVIITTHKSSLLTLLVISKNIFKNRKEK